MNTEQFDGHTRGPWRYYADDERDCWVFEGEDAEAQARVAFFAFIPCEGIAYLDDPDLNLMIAAPELLAALIEERIEHDNSVHFLRREYRTQMDYIEWLEQFAPKAGEYDTAWDAYEIAMGNHWTQEEE